MPDPSEDQDEGGWESSEWSGIMTAELGPGLGLPTLLEVTEHTGLDGGS